jgi:hypothetical protein
MKIARFNVATVAAWGLVDETGDEILQIAASLPSWSPRIAGGEGIEALPRTGRRHALAAVELLAPVSDGARVYGEAGWEAARLRVSQIPPPPGALALGVAVVGASLTGRRNPLRSVFGYGAAWGEILADGDRVVHIAPWLETRGIYGDERPDLGAQWQSSFGRMGGAGLPARDLVDRLRRIEAEASLRAGDLVIFALTTAAPEQPAPAWAVSAGGRPPAFTLGTEHIANHAQAAR